MRKSTPSVAERSDAEKARTEVMRLVPLDSRLGSDQFKEYLHSFADKYCTGKPEFVGPTLARVTVLHPLVTQARSRLRTFRLHELKHGTVQDKA